MTIRTICQRQVDLAGSEETVQVAAARMKARNVGSLMIVDDDRCPIGIVTDRDLAVRVVAEGASGLELTVGDVMSSPPITIPDTAAVEDALGLMRSEGIRRLIVVGKDGALVGVVSLDDVLGWISNEFRSVTGVLERSSPKSLKREAAKAKGSR
ncbi:MAG: CBS domain-containing protein [Planctomycetes bacterium]|nr:CBS domain-containing protein [Planctomycetota bacterium]